MRAAWYEKNGAARDVLRVGELPDPRPAPGEVLVKMYSSGVNPSDVKSRLRRPLPGPFVIPHNDGGGIIKAVGAGVSDKRIGQRVWIWNGQWQRPMGTACEFICLPETQAVELPDVIDFQAAACLGIPALTALQAIRLAGTLDGKTVVVIGAGNSVGHYVTQLAVQRGATVIATAGAEARKAHAVSAGASHVIDYKREPVAARIKELTGGQGADIIIDMDFSTTAVLISQGALRSHGSLITYGSNSTDPVLVDQRVMMWESLAIKAFLIYDLTPVDRSSIIIEMTDFLRANKLKHAIGPVCDLADIATAHELVESGSVVGNVLVSL
jgi:NADPH:quinone reductase